VQQILDQRDDGGLWKGTPKVGDNSAHGGAKPVDKFVRTGPLHFFDLRLRFTIAVYGQPNRQAGFRPVLQALALLVFRVRKGY